jgi:hypothetical protein
MKCLARFIPPLGAAGLALSLAAALVPAGCAANGPPAAPGGTFVAFASNFQGFHGWSSAAATPAAGLPAIDGGDGVAVPDGGAATDGGIHRLPLTVYWNQAPPSGSSAFPVGTIIVKETDEVDPTARQIFAMVKRGGNFNAAGAVDWEWFELKNAADGTVAVSWHGYGPPSGSGDVYGGNPAVCNSCHMVAAPNDYVWSGALQLSNF